MVSLNPVSWCNSSSAADVYIIRQNTKNDVAYMIGNSNAMNGIYKMPVWKTILIVFDCVLVVAFGVLGFLSNGTLRRTRHAAS